jgi:histidyl-tRNA synthetase
MSDKPKKPNKLKSRLPRGLADRGPAEIAATRDLIEKIRSVFELYGFEPVETPAIEYTDALGKFLPDQDRPNEGVFSFQDDDEQWLSLRYDLTAPLARYVADKIGKEDFVLPYRSYRYGWVFRNEKPGPGRFRQFMQFDADTVGSASPAADAEMCMMAADTMEALGFERGQYVVKVNNRKVLDGVMESIGLGGEENAGRRLTVLRAVDKLDRLRPEGVRQLLGAGRKDESGDFTKGANLSLAQADSIMSYLGTRLAVGHTGPLAPKAGWNASFDHWSLEVANSAIGLQGVDELRAIADVVWASGYEYNRLVFESSVVRGLEYYTGPIYEVELLLDTKDDKGRPVRFGSVGGGGRYDGLVARFRGEVVPATGFCPVVVTMFDRDRIADYQKMVAALRAANIRAELYLGNPKNFGNQLKYADKRNSPCVVIQGGDEKAKGEVTVKDLIVGAELAKGEAARAAHLQKQAEAQVTVAEAKLVEAVRAVLARHKVTWG